MSNFSEATMNPREAFLWEFILSRAAGFRSEVILGMSSYTGFFLSLLKYLELPILQKTSGWLLPFVSNLRKYFPSHIFSIGTFLSE